VVVALLASSLPGPVMAADQVPGWTFVLNAHFPGAPGDTLDFEVVATVATDEPAEVSYALRLLLPDGEEADFGTASPSYSRGMRGGTVTDTAQWQNAEAGPYAARVVWLDGVRETVVAEARGWVGSPDAPIIVLEGVQVDPPEPSVGMPARVSVTITNQGQSPGSRTTPVWVWLDDQTYQRIGTVTIRDLAPGETSTGSFSWTLTQVIAGTRLGARIGSITRGPELAPFTVAVADENSATAST
jgi:hypothetical protein